MMNNTVIFTFWFTVIVDKLVLFIKSSAWVVGSSGLLVLIIGSSVRLTHDDKVIAHAKIPALIKINFLYRHLN